MAGPAILRGDFQIMKNPTPPGVNPFEGHLHLDGSIPPQLTWKILGNTAWPR
jgi:hypothetical protein